MVATWTPHGFYVDTMWFLCVHHVVSRWTPHGFKCRHHMVSTWTPCGVQEITYKPAQKTALQEGWKPWSHHERLVTTQVTTGGWKLQSHHSQGKQQRVVTTHGNQGRLETKE